jgi:hypothetical protein
MKKKIYLQTLLASLFLISVSASEAPYKLAKSIVAPSYQDKVLSVYGKGTPDKIEKWYVTFEDASSPTGARVVVIRDNHIDKFTPTTQKLEGKHPFFDPDKVIVSVKTALKTARQYADEHHIRYDATRVLLERKTEEQAPAWEVELRDDGDSRGFIITHSLDGTFVRYKYQSHREDKDFDEVESTFLGVGGDLEEFFTGHRSVDR